MNKVWINCGLVHELAVLPCDSFASRRPFLASSLPHFFHCSLCLRSPLSLPYSLFPFLLAAHLLPPSFTSSLSPRLTACFPSYHPFIRSIFSLSVLPSLLPLLLASHTLPLYRSLHSSFRPSFSVPPSISLPLFFPPSLPCLSLPPSLPCSFHTIMCHLMF